MLNETHPAVVDPAPQDAAFPSLRQQPNGGELTQMVGQGGFRNAEMRLDVSDPAASVPRFHEMLEDLEPLRMAKLRQAAGRFAEPKQCVSLEQCVSLGQGQPQPCKKGRKRASGAGWRRLTRGFASLDEPAPPSPI